jgi:hypothetical protein
MFLLQMAKVAVSGSDVNLSQTTCLRLIRSPLKQDECDKVAQPVNKERFAAWIPRPCQDETSPWLSPLNLVEDPSITLEERSGSRERRSLPDKLK